MNRLKLWVYMAVVLGAGLGNLLFLSRWLTDRTVGQVDRELSRAAALVDARSQILAGEGARLAEAAARDPAVVQALSPEGGGDAAAAARAAAAETARGGAGADGSRSLLVATASAAGKTLRVNGAPIQADARIEELLSGVAADGVRREGYAAVGDTLYHLTAGSAGKGASVAVGVPITTAWLGALRASSGCDVTLLVGNRAPWGTLPAQEASLIANAARGAAGPAGAGTTFGTALPAPSLPLLFAKAPAYRIRTLALKGLPGGVLALSQATGPLLAPLVSYAWLSLAAIGILLLLGIATGLFVTNEQEAMVPKDLVAAADRITRGDFSARAPVMAGSLGTIATALNRAAEAAGAALAPASPAAAAGSGEEAGEAAPAPPPESEEGGTSPDFFSAPAGAVPSASDAASATPPAAPPEDTAAAAVARAEVSPASYQPEPLGHEDTTQPFPPASFEPPPGDGVSRYDAQEAAPPDPDLGGSSASAVAPAEPRAEDPGSFAPAAESGADAEPVQRGEAAGLGMGSLGAEQAAEIPRPPEPEPQLEFEASDEEHWRVVYGDFLRAREECGEPREGVPYDRFRQKLQKNRDQLVAKYACRTVRFQVYVKEGRAALKASPVR